MYTKHRLNLHSQTTLTNDGGRKNLDARRDGGGIGKIVLHIGGSAVAPGGVLRHVHPLVDSPRRCLADGGAPVPEVLPAAELEGILAGLIIAVPLEPAGGAFFLMCIIHTLSGSRSTIHGSGSCGSIRIHNLEPTVSRSMIH